MNNTVFCDCRISDKIRNRLEELGCKVSLIYKNTFFDEPVCAHADMNLLKIGKKLFISSKTFVRTELEAVETEGEYNKDTIPLKYPNDILLNCAVVGKDIICKENCVSRSVLNYATECGYRIVNVKQGYAKCNIAIVSKNAVITEDKSIYETLCRTGYDVLLLKTHSVNLEPYEYGFIGGASGKLDDNTLAFTGNIEKHPEYEKIYGFCKKYNVTPISLSDEPLYDYGSIVVV